MEKIVHDTKAKLHIEVNDSFRKFICNFYTEALAGMLIDLFQKVHSYDRDELFNYFSIILNTSLPAILCAQTDASSDNNTESVAHMLQTMP